MAIETTSQDLCPIYREIPTNPVVPCNESHHFNSESLTLDRRVKICSYTSLEKGNLHIYCRTCIETWQQYEDASNTQCLLCGFEYVTLYSVDRLSTIIFQKTLYDLKSDEIRDILRELIEKNDFNTLTRILRSKEYELWKSLLIELIESLWLADERAKILGIIKILHKELLNSEALRKLSEYYLEKGDRKNALEFAQLIPDEQEKSWALGLISDSYLKAGYKEEAVAVVKLTLNRFTKMMRLMRISNSYFNAGDIENALAVTELIPCEEIMKF